LKRLEQCIEARIEGKLKNGESISSKVLIAEVSGLMNMNPTTESIKSFKKTIRRVRNRLYSRQKRREEISTKLARDLLVSPKLETRWIEIDLLDPKRIREIERWKKIIIEREYFRQVKVGSAVEENIPMGRKQNLWD
jgi:hypothetical protein